MGVAGRVAGGGVLATSGGVAGVVHSERKESNMNQEVTRGFSQ